MNDGQRIYPVDYFFLHHSTGPDFVNASDIEVQDWYSNNGKARAYNNGAINPMHEHPSRPGELTYAQAQFTLREYSLDGNKYGWRLTDLIARPWQNVAWAVGNWDYNVKSSSVEICGNFMGKVLPEKALMCMADFLRGIDEELGGALKVWLHQEVYATACPGRIKEQRDTLVDMINNPAKWNAVLWPIAPVATTTTETQEIVIPFDTEAVNDPDLQKGTQETRRTGVNGKRIIVTQITKTDGKETSRKVISDTTTPPVSMIRAIGTKEKVSEAPNPDPELPENPEDGSEPIPEPETPNVDQAPLWTWLKKLINRIVQLIKKAWK